MRTEFMRRFVCVASFSISLIGAPAFSQAFPTSDDDGLLSYNVWKGQAEPAAYVEASVRTDSEGGWSELTVTRSTSVGVALEFIGFSLKYGTYDQDDLNQFKKLIGSDLASSVWLVVDSRIFEAGSATYALGDDGGLLIEMGFTPQDDDDGKLQTSEPNCQVLDALKGAHQIVVRFPNASGETVESLILTGRGSSAALRHIVCV